MAVPLPPGNEPIILCHKIDLAKVVELIEQTKIIELFKNYPSVVANNEALEKTFLSKVQVRPKIIDESGLYTGENLVKASSYVSNTAHIYYLDRRKYESTIVSTNDSYNLEITPNLCELKYNAEGHVLEPIVTVKAKRVVAVPSYENEDEKLRLVFDGRTLSLLNKSTDFVQVKSMVLYYNEAVYNWSLSEDNFIELPPETHREFEVKSLPFLSNFTKQTSYDNLTLSKARESMLRFGLAVKYRSVNQNIDRTLYNQKSYSLLEIIEQQNRGKPLIQ